jgi:cyanate lyase
MMDRTDVTELIVAARLANGISWASVAQRFGLSKEWTTAACLGQMALSADQAAIVTDLFFLPPEALPILQAPPYRGSLPTAVPADPLIYRFYELVSVYGTTFKALIQEEFGDGIMSAIDFRMDVSREEDPSGDRVRIVMSGKYLGYRQY